MTLKRLLILNLAAVSCAIPLAAQAAGKVVVTKSGNKILITGDGAANHVFLGTEANKLIIRTGQDNTVIQGTKDFPGFTGDLELNMGGGDDNVAINSQTLVLNNVTANMGTGFREWFALHHARLNGSLSVVSQATAVGNYPEASYITVQSATIRGNVTINTGRGSDQVSISTPTKDSVVGVGGNLWIDTRDSNDRVHVQDYASGKPPTGAGGSLIIRTGTGNDLVEMRTRANSMTINLGEGDDTLNASGCSAPSTISVDGNLGNNDTFANRKENSSRFIQALTGFEKRVNQ
jgi:hypothetical protein